MKIKVSSYKKKVTEVKKGWIKDQIVSEGFCHMRKCGWILTSGCAKKGCSVMKWSPTLLKKRFLVITLNIARGTTDPGYWVYNLNYLFDNIEFIFILAAEIFSSFRLNSICPLCLWQCFFVKCKIGHQMAPLAIILKIQKNVHRIKDLSSGPDQVKEDVPLSLTNCDWHDGSTLNKLWGKDKNRNHNKNLLVSIIFQQQA